MIDNITGNPTEKLERGWVAQELLAIARIHVPYGAFQTDFIKILKTFLGTGSIQGQTCIQ